MTKSLALDASTTCTGWCIAENTTYLASGVFQPQGKDVHERIGNFSDWLYATLTTGFFFFGDLGIDILFYEYPSGSKFHKSTLLLGALWHIAIMQCRLLNVEFVEVRPKEAKATGIYKVFNSKTKKIDLERLKKARQYRYFMVLYKRGEIENYNATAMQRQDDEIDSIGVWLAGMKKWSKQNELD